MLRSPEGIVEIDVTDLNPSELPPLHRQRSARTDASMRDGNSAHGNPQEDPEDQFSIDNDIGDTTNEERGAAEFLDMIPDRHGADGKEWDAEEEDDAEAE